MSKKEREQKRYSAEFKIGVIIKLRKRKFAHKHSGKTDMPKGSIRQKMMKLRHCIAWRLTRFKKIRATARRLFHFMKIMQKSKGAPCFVWIQMRKMQRREICIGA
jgi:hypothetical protein